jgi:hypothetical protein
MKDVGQGIEGQAHQPGRTGGRPPAQDLQGFQAMLKKAAEIEDRKKGFAKQLAVLAAERPFKRRPRPYCAFRGT